MPFASTIRPARRRRPRPAGRAAASRRGVASVLAMMFLILFGSLVAAMAVASTGNIRTAASHLSVMRAQAAAETGLRIAEHRLREAAGRFVVAESDITADFVAAAWRGDSASLGRFEVLPPASGHDEAAPPAGIAQALANHHAADVNIVRGVSGFVTAPFQSDPPADASGGPYASGGWLITPAVYLESTDSGQGPPVAYQVSYALLAGQGVVRLIADGIVFDAAGHDRPVRRTISRDIEITKIVEHAVISPSRIMIGKNVMVRGDLGASFDDVTFSRGDPLVLRSDFYGIDPVLDARLEQFWAALATNDVDGDNRLRIGHPIEGAGIPNDDDPSSDGSAFSDATDDGFLDEFDIFIRRFDAADGVVDGRVEIARALADVDPDLGHLIDYANPDRNRNGVFGFVDADLDNVFEPDDGETPLDFDARTGTWPDRELGWADGYIDLMDEYAKVAGSLSFRVTQSEWTAGQGAYQARLRGPIVPDEGEPPVRFGVDDRELPDITAADIVATEPSPTGDPEDARTRLQTLATEPFWAQVATQLGASQSALVRWPLTPEPFDAATPWFRAVWPVDPLTGVPENAVEAYYEKSPFNSPTHSDWYYRPVFKNFTFTNVEIPRGLNALFVNCTFIGVTHVRSLKANTHPYWSEYGALERRAGDPYPVPRHRRTPYTGSVNDLHPTLRAAAASTLPPNRPVLRAQNPMDKGDILLSEINVVGGYPQAAVDALPDPLLVTIDGVLQRVTDTKALSNNIRFHDCTFVGSLTTDSPQTFTQVRNKIQLTGATRMALEHPDPSRRNDPDVDLEALLGEDGFREVSRSQLMAPQYSVDVGTFNSPPTQDVRLKGAVIAGVLDVRGNAEITGSLLLTYRPRVGEGVLRDATGQPIGNPAGFNATIGYFGPDDGDFESLDPETLPRVGGVPIVGWDLDGDGLPDLPHNETPTPGQMAAGASPVPFHGYGRVRLNYDPGISLPAGVMLPLGTVRVPGGYREGALH